MGSADAKRGSCAVPVTPIRSGMTRLRGAILSQLQAPQMLAFLPAVTLLAYWAGGQTALLAAALIVPGLFALGGVLGTRGMRSVDGVTGLPARDAVVDALDAALPRAARSGRGAAAIAATIDRGDDALADLDPDARQAVLRAVADRMVATLRDGDVVARSGGTGFAIALPDLRRADHPTLEAIALRLQDAAGEPISIAGQRVFVTMSVGFAVPSRSPGGGEALLAAAERALAAARAAGGQAVRGYDASMADGALWGATPGPGSDDELARALDGGEIRPWFQPQVAAGDGLLLGFEALARWDHPKRGIVQPGDFLPRIVAAGLSRRLAEVMLYDALRTLRGWDRAGLRVPAVSVNFTPDDLSDPTLSDRIRWELDRFDIAPERLVIEVLETALDGHADAAGRTLRALRDLGCGIDIDDFGRGHTSIAGLRRFAATRLKIDRSLISGLDSDSGQREIAAAIVTMARGLGVATLAEGVERVTERAVLAEIGCDAVQGFAIARPMPADEVPAFLAGWRRKHAIARDIAPEPVHMQEAKGKTA